MTRIASVFALLALLSGCGLGETAATTAAMAESEAQQAREGKALEAKVTQQIQAAQQTAEAQRKAAEAAAQ